MRGTSRRVTAARATPCHCRTATTPRRRRPAASEDQPRPRLRPRSIGSSLAITHAALFARRQFLMTNQTRQRYYNHVAEKKMPRQVNRIGKGPRRTNGAPTLKRRTEYQRSPRDYTISMLARQQKRVFYRFHWTIETRALCRVYENILRKNNA